MFTGTQLSFAFIAGLLAGVSIGIIGSMFWGAVGDMISDKQPKHKSAPRKTSMPKLRNRVQGRPTNINEPPTEIRQAQFRTRRETRE